ncbi:MAG: flagellar export protein FliJ [Clostridiales bacterium]|jgi:flagellar FliJ protein|nr:flagellar export protein FliJ [Clostridiales bacterium]
MAKFKFKLKTLLSLRRQLEEQAKSALSKAIMSLNRELARLSGIRAAISASLDEFRVLSGGRFEAGRIKEYNRFISAMREREKAQLAEVKAAEGRVEQARRELLEAVQRREMLDKLRDKAYVRYLDDERHAEQMVVDEIISYKIGSNLNGESIEKTQ